MAKRYIPTIEGKPARWSTTSLQLCYCDKSWACEAIPMSRVKKYIRDSIKHRTEWGMKIGHYGYIRII